LSEHPEAKAGRAGEAGAARGSVHRLVDRDLTGLDADDTEVHPAERDLVLDPEVQAAAARSVGPSARPFELLGVLLRVELDERGLHDVLGLMELAGPGGSTRVHAAAVAGRRRDGGLAHRVAPVALLG